MPTKKAPQAKLSKKDTEFLRFIGKNISDMRKTLAGLVGGQSKLENDTASAMNLAKETSGKVRKLIVDPLYSVPARLEKTVTELKDETLRKFGDVYLKLRNLEDEFKPVKKTVKDIKKKFDAFDLAFDVLKEKQTMSEQDVANLISDQAKLKEELTKTRVELEQLQSEHHALYEVVEVNTETLKDLSDPTEDLPVDSQALNRPIEATPRGSLGEEVEDNRQMTLDESITKAKAEGDVQNANSVT